jgi:hypothetical protein
MELMFIIIIILGLVAWGIVTVMENAAKQSTKPPPPQPQPPPQQPPPPQPLPQPPPQQPPQQPDKKKPLDELNDRYAKGEIGEKEYKAKKKDMEL